MNPEFQRNLWIELTPRRMILMAVLLALAFFAAAVSGDINQTPADAARWLFAIVVVVWGTRNAATAVVSEIRDRTWDMQRLSALGPGAMMWGKLFGATSFNWFGGALCLAVIVGDAAMRRGAAAAAADLVYYVAVGVIAQAAAFLASLVAVRRRQSHSRLDVFVYQAVGLAAALAVHQIWSVARVAPAAPWNDLVWWGVRLDARVFLLASLAVFAGWIVTGCYREMRLELMMRNGIAVWLAFLVFIGLYVAGFDAWLPTNRLVAGYDAVALRLLLATAAYAILTYAMVILEPKDRVHYRWLGSQLSSARLGAFFGGLQSWMMAYAAALVCAAAAVARLELAHPDMQGPPALIAAGLGFLTRDVALFVVMRSRRRGDLATLGILLAAYVLVPAILKGLGFAALLVLFLPQPEAPSWIGAALAWGEGLALAALALSGASSRRSSAGRSEPSPAS
ncbi:MAG: hypothetical protein JO261_00535 [Alphaproteobacteria bacterium]|nr:hypothetical protein [Alphaproteobacteria bacterium]MBV9692161.1 hypothetical protein [Alphaproteobacteria bacterium]